MSLIPATPFHVSEKKSTFLTKLRISWVRYERDYPPLPDQERRGWNQPLFLGEFSLPALRVQLGMRDRADRLNAGDESGRPAATADALFRLKLSAVRKATVKDPLRKFNSSRSYGASGTPIELFLAGIRVIVRKTASELQNLPT